MGDSIVEEQVQEWDGIGMLPTLYSRTATGAVNLWQCWVEGYNVRVRWGQENGTMQDATFACAGKNAGRINATTSEQQAVKEAIAKWQKQVKKKYHWQRAETAEVRRKPMLAKPWKEHYEKLVFPVVVQPKYDGLRSFAYMQDSKPYLQSRGGDPYTVRHIMAELSDAFSEATKESQRYILDGELYIHGVNLQTLNSYVRRPQEDSGLLSYMVYDIAYPDTPDLPYVDRRAILDKYFEYYSGTVGAWVMVRPVPSVVVDSVDDVMRMHDEFVRRGFEGAIVRSLSHPYRFGFRSDGLLKVKAWQDAEFRIVDYTVGRGKFENVPIFKCVTDAGKTFDVAPKGTDSERLAMLQRAPTLIGQMLKVQYFDYTADGVPHYPVGLGLRDRSDL